MNKCVICAFFKKIWFDIYWWLKETALGYAIAIVVAFALMYGFSLLPEWIKTIVAIVILGMLALVTIVVVFIMVYEWILSIWNEAKDECEQDECEQDEEVRRK